MKKQYLLIYNTLLLTSVSLYMRTVGLIFQVYISNKIGAAGVGLFSLVLSVQSLAITLATSGIRFAVTRLVAEEIGLQRYSGISPVLRRAFAYAISFSTLAGVLLYFGSGYIGSVWVGDERTVISLKILPFCLPFISLSSVMSGYFTAVSRVMKSAVVQILEQLAMIGCVLLIVPLIPPERIDLACAAIVLANLAADIVSFIICSILFWLDKRRYPRSNLPLAGISARLLRLAAPLALSSYARISLSTLQHLLVPGGLRRSGIAADDALAAYGVIQGMVFPLLTFPSAFFFSISELLIPELTEAQISGNTMKAGAIVNRIFSLCAAFSVACAGIIYSFGDELGFALYGAAGAGHYIKLLAPLVVIMFLDTVTDGMLKGLGQQLHSMAINIADAFISVLLVYFLLPIWAIKAYIIIIYITELFNFVLSLIRLSAVVEIRLQVSDFLKPLVCVFAAVQSSILLLRIIGLPLGQSVISATAHIVLSVVFCAACFKLIFPECMKISLQPYLTK